MFDCQSQNQNVLREDLALGLVAWGRDIQAFCLSASSPISGLLQLMRLVGGELRHRNMIAAVETNAQRPTASKSAHTEGCPLINPLQVLADPRDSDS